MDSISLKLKNIDINDEGTNYEYQVLLKDKNIGYLKLSQPKKYPKSFKIENLKIKDEFRKRKYAEKAIIILCQTYPNVDFYGEIYYEVPINFWKKFDIGLKNLKTEFQIQEFINLYGLFEFNAKDVLRRYNLI